MSKVKAQAEWYATDGLPIQTKLTELAAGYDSIIGWQVQVISPVSVLKGVTRSYQR